MELQMAILVGALYAGGVYLMLRRNITKLLFGLVLLGHASNLLILGMGRLVHGHAPIIPRGETVLVPPYADPLPQAMILTAIVIGFGVQAFAIILLRRVYQVVGSDDLDSINSTECAPELGLDAD